jgi:ElaB/YqjD/DUF883 family membrane-anchored ribosome-binding protein
MIDRNTTDAVTESVQQGYEAAREYTDRGLDWATDMSENLRDFVMREPWIALGAAFAIGYTLARLMRRVS